MQRESEKENTGETDEASIVDGSATKSGNADEAAPADGVSNGRGKRKRGPVDPDDGRKEGGGLDEENLKKRTIRELRALARLRRVSSFGKKEEFVKRLICVAYIAQGEEPKEIEEEKIVTAANKVVQF